MFHFREVATRLPEVYFGSDRNVSWWPPRSKPIEPYSGDRERELDTANEDPVNKGEDLNELRELVDHIKDQVA